MDRYSTEQEKHKKATARRQTDGQKKVELRVEDGEGEAKRGGREEASASLRYLYPGGKVTFSGGSFDGATSLEASCRY
jgi:hypothetical protein